jgi:outer membrane protein assembly factor BamB
MAHIAIICPHCQSRYQVEPDLRGKAMRCPNPVCRQVFEVKEEETPPPGPGMSAPGQDGPKPISRHVTGSVGDMVPILTGEAVDASTPLLPEQSTSSQVEEQVPLVSGEAVDKGEKAPRSSPPWERMPPPVRRDQTPEKSTSGSPPVADAPGSPKVTADSGSPKQPQVVEEGDDFLDTVPEEESVGVAAVQEFSGTWEAPPIRNQSPGRVIQHSGIENQSDSSLATGHWPPATDSPRSTRRRIRRVIALLLVLLSGGVAWGIWFAKGSRKESEDGLYQKAEALYQERNFAEAVVLLQALNRDFPDSKKRNHYRFLAELSDVRDPVYSPQGGPEDMVKSLDRLLQFLKVYHKDDLLTPYEGDVWLTLYKLGKELTDQADQKKDRLLLDRARQALEKAGTVKAPPDANAREKIHQAEKEVATVQTRILEGEQRQALIERIKTMKPSAQAVQEARLLVHKAKQKDDPESQKAKQKDDPELRNLLTKLVEDHIAGVTFTAVSASPLKPAAVDAEPSMLFAPQKGKAMGVPGVEDQRPVFALVRGMLYALAPKEGNVLWARRVGADTALLPLRLPATPFAPEIALVLSSDSRTLTALETANGRSLWEHQLEEACLGQPVLAGNRLLIPTYSGRVEEIDVGAGRLLGYYNLGQPLTVGGVLDERTGLAYFPADHFAIYVLDVARRKCAAVLYAGHPNGSLRSVPVILGEPAPSNKGLLILPQADGLDALVLRAFELPAVADQDCAGSPEAKIRGWSWFPPYSDGERLALATDAGVFALFGFRRKGNRDPLLFPMLKEEVVLSGTGPGRAQIVHADAENFWVLARGRLQRLQLTFSPKTGPGVLDLWAEPPILGSPIHAAQVRPALAGNVLFLVTRSGQACFVSAVADKTGTILWQRRLGLECRGQPLLVGKQVLVQDPAGTFLFHPDKGDTKNRQWQQGGVRILDSSPQARNVLVPSETGATILSLTGLKLKLAHVLPDQDKAPPPIHFELPAGLAGTPAQGKDCLILPLANGILHRLPLNDGPVIPGPNWRAAGTDEDALGHVLAMPGNHYLISDGGRGLHLLHWPEPKVWDKRKSVQLSRRIVAPPILVPGKEKTRVCVADAADTVTLLDAETLAPVRSWAMPGPISAGPFVQGSGIGCVIGKNRLVWIDPGEVTPLWEYALGEIVGVPQLVDGVLVVANLAGQFMGLDPATGRRRGPGYTLKANVAPTASPVPFGPERLFAPLSDGTIMLLARKYFRGEEKGSLP